MAERKDIAFSAAPEHGLPVESLGHPDSEGVRIAEERLAAVLRGDAKLVPIDEALRSLGL